MYSYSQIFLQALRIAIKKPSFWFFGMFAALLGSAGEFEILLGGYGFTGNSPLVSFLSGLSEGGLFTLAGTQGLLQNPVTLFLLLTIFLFIVGFVGIITWLVMVSQSALIGRAVSVSQGKDLSWGDSFQLGIIKFWPVLSLNFLVRIIATGLLILAGLIAISTFPGSALVYLVTFNVFIVLTLILSFITKYAICGVVLKDLKFRQSLRTATSIFRNNILISLEIAIILFLIYLFVNSLLFFSLALLWLIGFKFFIGFTFGVYLIFILLFLLFLVVEVILSIFHWSTWAIVFELLSSKEQSLRGFIKSIYHHYFG